MVPDRLGIQYFEDHRCDSVISVQIWTRDSVQKDSKSIAAAH